MNLSFTLHVVEAVCSQPPVETLCAKRHIIQSPYFLIRVALRAINLDRRLRADRLYNDL